MTPAYRRAPRVNRGDGWVDTIFLGVDRDGFECYAPRAVWPPPARGTHESDLYRQSAIEEFHNLAPDYHWKKREFNEFMAAQAWSLRGDDA